MTGGQRKYYPLQLFALLAGLLLLFLLYAMAVPILQHTAINNNYGSKTAVLNNHGGQTAIVSYWEPTAVVNYRRPDMPINYYGSSAVIGRHGLVAVISHIGQPDGQSHW